MRKTEDTQHIKGVDHTALLTFLLTKHISSYNNVFKIED